MPLGSDASTGGKRTRDLVDKDIIAAAAAPAASPIAASSGTWTPPSDYTGRTGFQDHNAPQVRKDANDLPWMEMIRAEMNAQVGGTWSGPVALPVRHKFEADADISAGKVSESPRMYGPFPKPARTTSPVSTGPDALWNLQEKWARDGAIRRSSTPEARAEADAAFDEMLRKNGIDPSSGEDIGVGSGIRGLMSGEREGGGRGTWGASRGPAEVADELGMKAGALTTVDIDKPPTRDETVRQEVADASGLRGSALDLALGYRAAREQTTGEPEQTRGEDQAAMSEAARAFKSGMRSTRIGINQGGSTDDAKAMSSEAYAKLSPQQKAAVELNSMLTNGSREERKSVLDNIGWDGAEGGASVDLNNILNGKLLFTRQDIADLGPSKGGPDASLNTPEHLRDEMQTSLVKAFTSARKEPIQGSNLLAAKREATGYDKLPGSDQGGREVMPGVTVGKFIQSGFDLLANSNSGFTAEQIIADAKDHLAPEEFQAFLNFVDINSRDAKKYRQPLGDNAEQTYFDPVEFRKSIATALRGAR